MTPTTGTLEPHAGTHLEFVFKSSTLDEHVYQRYNVFTEASSFTIVAEAIVTPLQIELSTNAIQFGEVPCGKEVKRTLQIRNESAADACYHIINQEARGVFNFDRPTGVVQAGSFIAVTVSFWPGHPANHYKRCFVAVQRRDRTESKVGLASPDQSVAHLSGSSAVSKPNVAT